MSFNLVGFRINYLFHLDSAGNAEFQGSRYVFKEHSLMLDYAIICEA